MKELTGADDAVGAWRSFFEPGDVVGIKMNPVGNPLANSSSELMLEVIDGLKAAGVKTKDMIVFERYRDEFIGARMHEAVPDGVAWAGLGRYNAHQIDIKGDPPIPNSTMSPATTPTSSSSMELVGHGRRTPRTTATRRSHLGLLVTRRVNKIVLLPVLKDHGSAGVTGALKNMSHGLVNNVSRSHSTPDTNVCNQFIPQVVSHPIIRKKCVLQIMDGDQGRLPGRPAARSSTRSGPGRTTRSCSRPTPWRWTTSPGARSTPSDKEKGLPPSRRSASWASIRWTARASTSASPSTSRWPATWATASSNSTPPKAAAIPSIIG